MFDTQRPAQLHQTLLHYRLLPGDSYVGALSHVAMPIALVEECSVIQGVGHPVTDDVSSDQAVAPASASGRKMIPNW